MQELVNHLAHNPEENLMDFRITWGPLAPKCSSEQRTSVILEALKGPHTLTSAEEIDKHLPQPLDVRVWGGREEPVVS